MVHQLKRKFSFKHEVSVDGIEVTIDELRRKMNQNIKEAPRNKGNLISWFSQGSFSGHPWMTSPTTTHFETGFVVLAILCQLFQHVKVFT